MKSERGFSLVELLVYVAMLAIISGLLTGILYNSVRITNREGASTEVVQQLNQVMGTVQKLVGDASLIESVYKTDNDINPDNDPASTAINSTNDCDAAENFCTLKLRFEGDSVDPTWMIASSTGIYLVRGDDGETPPDGETSTLLTTDAVDIDYLRFTRYELAGGHTSIKVNVSFTYNTDNDKFRITRTLTSAIGRVTAATFDDSLLPGSTTYNVGSSGSQWQDGFFSRNLSVGGNVGIGTTGPTARLQINPTVTATTDARMLQSGIVYNGATAMANWYGAYIAAPTGTGTITNKYALVTEATAGNVGIGTTNPGYKLAVAGTGNFTDVLTTSIPSLYTAITSVVAAPIDVPEVNTGSGGFVPLIRGRTLITAGYRKHVSIGSYRTGSGWDGGIYLGQGGNDSYPTEYFLMGSDGALTHSTGKITTSGNVGIGTTAPVSKLAVNGVGVTDAAITGHGAGMAGGQVGVRGYGNYAIVGNSSLNWDFWAEGTAPDYGTASSIRWKNNVVPIDNALDKVLKLNGVYFNWDTAHGGQHGMGMIAEDVGKVVPEVVGWESDGSGYATGMDYGHLTPVLVEAIKEQQEQINFLTKKFSDLTGEEMNLETLGDDASVDDSQKQTQALFIAGLLGGLLSASLILLLLGRRH